MNALRRWLRSHSQLHGMAADDFACMWILILAAAVFGTHIAIAFALGRFSAVAR
ncbi:MAG TPA: hypothetical protein VN622_09020 [Clostridia bacterium]|nr:hypothetical protein [Clostridia bacterium]